ncbi:MAG: NAD-dependent epimerase/dehydratase family protein [Clostridiaceae bacterium]|jgi:nucleoside-diphosphate-sugar epimerase|nr:NAD-dependent epimerase/dehydratase family protein [Clostridiaceae bacterium]
MNVFVTGASGFVGTHLVKALSEFKNVDNIFALYRKKEQIAFLPKVNPVLGELSSLTDLKLDARIDILVHLAGYFKTESKKLCEVVNVQGTKSAVTLCKNNNIPKILFFSTINVDLKSKGNYAKSKLLAEEEVKNSGLEYMILRPSLIYSGRSGSLGRIISSAEKLPFVPVFGSGKAKEQPIHIEELINLTLAVINDFKPGKTLYAAGLEPMSFKELIAIIGKGLNKKTRVFPIPARPVYWLLKLIEKTGLSPGISSEQVAHMSEDLAADMSETLALYPVELKPFEERMVNFLNSKEHITIHTLIQ